MCIFDILSIYALVADDTDVNDGSFFMLSFYARGYCCATLYSFRIHLLSVKVKSQARI